MITQGGKLGEKGQMCVVPRGSDVRRPEVSWQRIKILKVITNTVKPQFARLELARSELTCNLSCSQNLEGEGLPLLN